MFNRVVLIGRLTADPELKTTNSGTAVCSFTLAVDRQFKDQNGNKQVDFLNVVTWKGTAEFVSKYFSKGSAFGVEGSVQTRNWTDKDGNKRIATEIVADRAFFTGSKETNAPKAENDAQGEFGGFGGVPADEQDLPF
jgi:single-strand DNA-binding protein